MVGSAIGCGREILAPEEGFIHAVGEHFDGLRGGDLAAEIRLVVRPADDGRIELRRGRVFVPLELPDVLAPQHLFLQAELQVMQFLGLEKQVHPAAIHDAARAARERGDILPDDEVAEMDDVVTPAAVNPWIASATSGCDQWRIVAGVEFNNREGNRRGHGAFWKG